MNSVRSESFDFIIIGAGISGPFIAHELCKAGSNCLMLEAGKHYTRHTYPHNELDGTSQMYWSGGLELSTDAKLVFLRPKVVGGGSIVNQALVDRFDTDAFNSWKAASGVSFFNNTDMDPWYTKAESEISIQEIPPDARNENARIFQEGFEKLGYQLAPLHRAQKDCRYGDGNCCIECLNGCRIGSKQSTPETVLKKALEHGLQLESEKEAVKIVEIDGGIQVQCRDRQGRQVAYQGRGLILAGGAIGNSRLLLNSGYNRELPHIGHDFYCHPQYMNFGIYDKPINAHIGAFQAFKSDDPGFRKEGFKLENVYVGPSAIAMLVSGFGRNHHRFMEKLSHFACMEVCTRDTHPGRIKLNRKGKVMIHKVRSQTDMDRFEKGVGVIDEIFRLTGAQEIVHGSFGFGLHLMGGCVMGTDPAASVVNPEFRLHGKKNIYVADSSIFPNAPGINPSLTIMALSKMAADQILRNVQP